MSHSIIKSLGLAATFALLPGVFACSSASHAATDPSGAGADTEGVSLEAPKLVAPFAVARGELPEGLAVSGGVPYVGLAPSGQISKVSLIDGSLAPFAKLPSPVPNKGFMTGLAFSKSEPGELYAALVSFVPDVAAGIYRVGAKGGDAELFAADAGMVFPNGLLETDAGEWFVADSAAGAIFKLSKSGKSVEKWASDALLAGDNEHSCASQQGAGLPFPIGANGIVQQDGALYVTNTDKGLIARIALNADGTAGKISLFAGPDCKLLGGADGIVSLNHTLLVANNFANQLVTVDAKGAVTVAAAGTPLDFPASPVVDGDNLYVTNFAFMNAQAGKGNPGLVRLQVQAAR